MRGAGHWRPEGAGRPAAPASASTSHLSDARPGADPHGFLQPHVALAPGGREEPEPAPERQRAAAGGGGAGLGAREGRGEGASPWAGLSGPGGADGRGGGARRSPETRARSAATAAHCRPPAQSLRRLARSPASALTHIPSIPEELLGGRGSGLGNGRLRRRQQGVLGQGVVQPAGVFEAPSPRRPLS